MRQTYGWRKKTGIYYEKIKKKKCNQKVYFFQIWKIMIFLEVFGEN